MSSDVWQATSFAELGLRSLKLVVQGTVSRYSFFLKSVCLLPLYLLFPLSRMVFPSSHPLSSYSTFQILLCITSPSQRAMPCPPPFFLETCPIFSRGHVLYCPTHTVPLAWGLPEVVGSPASVPGKLTSIGPWQRRR